MRVLDLFCGAGGASMGYYQAGFEVIGVDIKPQPHYPFEFIQAGWEESLQILPGLWEREKIPYVIHASPPCQRYSTMTKRWGRENTHPDLIGTVREYLELIDAPYIIENVPGAPLYNVTMLCGSMFKLGSAGYGLRRHRIFETKGFNLKSPRDCNHIGAALPVYGHSGGKSKRDGLQFPGIDSWREGMKISWMTGKELAEAIPPAYTEYIGKEIIKEYKQVPKRV